jgi:hypothetical protein
MAILGLVYHWLFTVMFLEVPSMGRLSDEQAQVGQFPSLSLTEHGYGSIPIDTFLVG